MESQNDKILAYHRGGKVSLGLPKAMATASDLCVAYTPGVAVPTKEIAARPETVFDYTAKGNLVAVVSDGTAILGLGDLGAAASIPVMEGKAVLFKTFGDVNGWPVPLDHCRVNGGNAGKTDPQRVIDAVMAIAPMYGGINLEDIAAPACFEIEERLDAMLDIPVFHDDQWGTAVIASAAVRNIAQLKGRKLGDLKLVINGAGSAGCRIADMCQAVGVEDVTMCDRNGILTPDYPGINPMQLRHAVKRSPGRLEDAVRGADIFIGVSAGGALSGDAVKTMADFPAICALANPEPEIRPEAVKAAMGDKPYVMATGRSDYPNQVNNVLCFPFLFRGALDVGARTVNLQMKLAASQALSDAVHVEAPDHVRALYPDEALEFGREYILPKAFDRSLFVSVSCAVAKAAVESGVARWPERLATLEDELNKRNVERFSR